MYPSLFLAFSGAILGVWGQFEKIRPKRGVKSPFPAISILGSKMGPGMARMDWLGKNLLKLVGIDENWLIFITTAP